MTGLKHALIGLATVAVLALTLVGLAAMPRELLAAIGFGLMVVAFVAIADFIRAYKPWAPWKHNREGRHLLAVSYSLLALFGVSIFSDVVALPDNYMLAVAVLVVAAITITQVQRRLLLRRHQREKRNR